jgi:hypothetical protein
MRVGTTEEAAGIELQHINLRLRFKDPDNMVLDSVVPIFHRWIQDQVFDELLLDVADYRHVSHGPGVVLVGHEADYSVDYRDGHLGVRYNRKAVLRGSNREKIQQAFHSAANAAERLESDTVLNGKLSFKSYGLEVFVNDRLIAPQGRDTQKALERDFRAFLDRLFGGEHYLLRYENQDPRQLFGFQVSSQREYSVSDLRQNLDKSDAIRGTAFDGVPSPGGDDR